jgi:hypothetical protein
MKAKKILLGLIVLVGILPFLMGICLVLTGARQPLAVGQTVLSREPLMSGFEFIKYEKGKKLFTVSAKEAYVVDKKLPYFGFCLGPLKTTRLEDVEVVFFEDNLAVSRLLCRFGSMDLRKKEFVFEDKPSLLTQDQRHLSAERISWSQGARTLRAEGNCFLTIENKEVSAEGLTVDYLLENFQLIR